MVNDYPVSVRSKILNLNTLQVHVKKLRLLIAVAVCFASVSVNSQGDFYAPALESMVTFNPAAAGAEGDGTLRMLYIMRYPERNFNLHYLSVSYDTYISLLHGGISGFVTDNYQGGIINNISGGLSYSYHLQAGRDLFINAGLSAVFQHRGINSRDIIMPDQIDPVRGPVLPSGEIINGRGRTVFDVGTGFMIMSGNYTGGISVNHLAKPDMAGRNASEDQLPWHFTIFSMTIFNLSQKSRLNLQPLLLFDLYGKDITAEAGAMLGTEKASVSSLFSFMSNGDVNLQSGFSFQIFKGLFFYNYCFNLTSVNGMLPFTMYHMAGLSISLNNVDKRKVIKAIKFPNL